MNRRLAVTLVLACVSVASAADDKAEQEPKWTSLFDGKSLAGWKTTEFGAHKDPVVENGLLVLPVGDPLTGVTREKDDVPHVNYEVQLEAQRVEGHDFFLGLTFPVQDSHASLILGGWSGGVCGISSIDGFDASENSTTSFRKFESGKWYKVRLRVTKERIDAWLDDEQIVDADIVDKKISTRVEVSPSKPFGIATYATRGAYRNIRVRGLTADEVKQAPAGKAEAKGFDPSKAGKR
jgi:hypothetical protein